MCTCGEKNSKSQKCFRLINVRTKTTKLFITPLVLLHSGAKRMSIVLLNSIF